MRNESRAAGWILLAWAIWVSLDYWCLGDLSYVRVHDTATCHLPVVLSTTGSLGQMLGALRGSWLCGIDRLATLGWWNSFYLPFLLLPPWLAHGVVTFVQRFVAAYFTYRLACDVLGARRAVGVAAGCVYSLTHTNLGEFCFMHGLNEPGFPLLLWFFCRLDLDRPVRAAALSALLGVALGWAMSHLIGTLFLVPAGWLFAVAIRRDLGSWRRHLALLGGLGAFLAVATLRQLPELWALAVNGPLSYRGQTFGLEPPNWRAFGHEVVRFLVAWWPFTLAVAAWLWRTRVRTAVDRAILVMLLLGVVIAPALDPLRSWVAPYIGFLRGVDFTRFAMVSQLAVTLALARLLDTLPEWRLLVSDGARDRLRASLPTLASVAAALVAGAWSVHMKSEHWTKMRTLGHNWRAIFGHPDLPALVADARAHGWRMATAGCYHNLHAGYLMAYGAETADGHAPMYDRRYYDFWTAVIGGLLGEDAEIRGFHKWGSYVYLHHARSGADAEVREIPFARWYDLDLLSLAGVRYLISDKPIQDERLRPVPLPEQDRRAADWPNLGRAEHARRFLAGTNPPRKLFAYENAAALPRFFLVGGLRSFAGTAALNEAMARASVREMAAEAFVTEGDAVKAPDDLAPAAGQLSWERALGEGYRVRVELPRSQILVCTDQFYRWWEWRVDGRPVSAFPVYGAFMGVLVPAGAHRIEADYRPPYGAPLRRLNALFGGS